MILISCKVCGKPVEKPKRGPMGCYCKKHKKSYQRIYQANYYKNITKVGRRLAREAGAKMEG